jgi:hypothetical protein
MSGKVRVMDLKPVSSAVANTKKHKIHFFAVLDAEDQLLSQL